MLTKQPISPSRLKRSSPRGRRIPIREAVEAQAAQRPEEDRAAQAAREVSRNAEEEAGRKAEEDRLAKEAAAAEVVQRPRRKVRKAKRRLQQPRKQRGAARS